ncbi:NAD-dependent succinate-semialdehyde dehydrogenase [Roseivivax sp. CAU 1761]
MTSHPRDLTPPRPPLAETDLLRDRLLIGAAWVAAGTGATFAVSDPVTGADIARLPQAGAAEAAAAIAAAEAALPEWRARTAADRAQVLERWHALIEAHADDLAALMTREQGKPLSEARGEIAYGASFVKWFAEEARRAYGETIPAPVADRRILVQKQAVGVCAAITPWNFPNAMITRKVAPALAAGCTIVVKPSELTPLSALALGVLAERAGLPAGVLNIVAGDAAAIGATLCASPAVRKLSFTGSTRVGKILMARCADTVKRLSRELGGNAPFLVFDDADLEAAVEGAMASKFRNGGQTCVCANRIYVQAGIHDAFVARLAERAAALRVGDGFAEGVEIGPMINDAAIAKIRAHVEDAVAKGAQVETGGVAVPGGRFFAPTVLSGVTGAMMLAHEETFGPVAPVFRFETEAEAVAAANDTPYGLAAYLYTRDLARAFRAGEAIEAGMVCVNVGGFATEVAPFGGIKESGLGREGAHHGLDEYLELKTLHIGGI